MIKDKLYYRSLNVDNIDDMSSVIVACLYFYALNVCLNYLLIFVSNFGSALKIFFFIALGPSVTSIVCIAVAFSLCFYIKIYQIKYISLTV